MKALIFTGQGAQFSGMGQLANQITLHKIVNKMQAALPNKNIIRLFSEADDEELKHTDNAQLAMFALGYSLGLDYLKNHEVQIMAGHSLGQYIALALAGVLEFETICELLAHRSNLMMQCEGKMLVVLAKLEIANSIANLASDGIDNCFIANINSSTQTVLSGSITAIDKAATIASKFGKKSVPLATSGPFHSPYMQKIALEFKKKVDELIFAPAKIPVISNVFASTEVNWQDEMKLHMIACVRWAETMKLLENYEITELGPKPVLTGIANRDGYNVKYFNE